MKVAAGLASTILIINYLDPSDYGVLALALATFGVISAFTSLGLDSILFKTLIQDFDHRVLKESVILRLIMAVLTTFVLLIALISFGGLWLYLLTFLTFSLYFTSLQGLKEAAFSQKKYEIIALAGGAGGSVRALSVAILVVFKAPLIIFTLPFLLDRITYVLVLACCQISNLKSILEQRSFINYKLAKDGLPLMIATIAGLTYAAQDQWMIAFYMTNDDVGIYAAGIQPILIMAFLPTIITNFIYHKIVDLRENHKSVNYIQSMYSLLFYFGVSVCILIFLLSEYLISFAFPSSYSGAISVLKIYSLTLLVAFFQSLNNKILVLENLQNLIPYRVISALVVNFVLNIYLIPVYGINGAAVATVLSEIFILISYSFTSSTRQLFRYQLRAINPLNIVILKTVD